MLKFTPIVIGTSKRPLFSELNNRVFNKVQVAGAKQYYPKEPVDKSEWPEYRKLRQLERKPDFGNVKALKMPKMLKYLRGPELVHTQLLYKGYGIKALLGGRLTHEHMDWLRVMINKKLDTKRMFALWRIDAVWQPVGKRSTGKRMGGGKGSIHHYVTPVHADRIILELAGDIHEIEARKILNGVVSVLPFPCRVVSHSDLEAEKKDEEWVEKNNINPFTMQYVILNNMGGCHKWISKYDKMWFGKYK